jgi:hypothetical protein
MTAVFSAEKISTQKLRSLAEDKFLNSGVLPDVLMDIEVKHPVINKISIIPSVMGKAQPTRTFGGGPQRGAN